MEMMSRCTSLVPPPKVRMSAERYIRSSRLRRIEPGATVLLRDRRPEELRPREGVPGGAVDAVGLSLDTLQPLVRRVVGENLRRQLAESFLLGCEREIHRRLRQRARGMPRPAMAMMSRWTSLVPPPKVRMRVVRYIRSTRPRSTTSGDPARSVPTSPITSRRSW